MTFQILTVCVGNVCRSPLMERLLRERLGSPAFGVSSAGIHGMVGSPMERSAAAQLIRLGGSPEGFAGRRIDTALITGSDLILTATRAVRGEVLALAPGAMHRTFTLLELAAVVDSADELPSSPGDLVTWAARHRSSAQGDLDIVDPIGRSAQIHRQAADLIDAGVASVVRALLGQPRQVP